MMNTIILFVWVLSSFISFEKDSLALRTDSYSEIEKLINEEYEKGNFSGSIVIGNKDGMLFQKHAGIANRVWNIPVASDTRFDIASVNKSFIAALILKAVEEKRLELDSKLVDLLDDVSYSGRFNSSITIHQMLSHTSGIPDYDGVPEPLKKNEFSRFKRLHFDPDSYTDFISQLPPRFNPGEGFYYSNFGYHLLAIILEKIYEKPFEEILKEKISIPYGLDQTFSTTNNEEVFPRLAEAYNYKNGAKEWYRNSFIDLTLGRRIFSTAGDLFKWGQVISKLELLEPLLQKKMTTNHLESITDEMSYGYGWVVYQPGDHFQMGDLGIDLPYLIHGGSTEGYRSMLIIIDEGKLIFSMTTNSGNRANEMELSKRIVQLLIAKK
ncbi:class A beta-lactamase-related serine hydrolase [Algoriphagus kandeliae]|uniref:Class A beta-lactamase-related serine hydrolase n=1 Tax=Algoriphagus kandeliae TaxID=2562278 RepID=A0A4Y9R2S5_9BACT|nr:serine hydrolase domain-containing protein [Algoriphagus kandeliae]TFV97816.1 class A beta-lactamase-related serine hydrolase [Algoriphagus kandeliae]